MTDCTEFKLYFLEFVFIYSLIHLNVIQIFRSVFALKTTLIDCTEFRLYLAEFYVIYSLIYWNAIRIYALKTIKGRFFVDISQTVHLEFLKVIMLQQ